MIIIAVTTAYFSPYGFGQDIVHPENKTIIYSMIVNIVPDQFNFPLVGFVNLAYDSHNSAHIGFINVNEKDFTGAQISFVNTVGGGVKGAQIGFVNMCEDPLTGLKLSFVNTAGKHTDSAQIGFVNNTKVLKGLQLGFVNYTDTIEKGIQLGFLSIVKKGGYRAFKISVTEMYHVNLSFKIGVKKLYSSFTASYNSDWGNIFAAGIGLGSIMPFNKSLYFNPELSSQSAIIKNDQQIFYLTTSLGYYIKPKIQFTIGPSVVWNYAQYPDDLNKPFFSIYTYDIDNSNKLILGLRAALRYNLTDLSSVPGALCPQPSALQAGSFAKFAHRANF
jgi:hypothetical protein